MFYSHVQAIPRLTLISIVVVIHISLSLSLSLSIYIYIYTYIHINILIIQNINLDTTPGGEPERLRAGAEKNPKLHLGGDALGSEPSATEQLLTRNHVETSCGPADNRKKMILCMLVCTVRVSSRVSS